MTFSKTHSTGFLANHMARLFAIGLQNQLRAFGVAPAQFMVLVELWDQDGQTQAQLTEKLDVEQATMANTLSRMQRDGLIVRRPSESDGRSKIISLTERAHELQAPALNAAQATNAQALASLDADDHAKLNDLMKKVISSLKQG